MNQAKVTVVIPTKNRYDSLDKTLLSIALQTVKPLEVIIFDDSEKPTDIRNILHYEYILRLLNEYGIEWIVLPGQRKGQHYSHEHAQEIGKGDFIFRIDDDEVAEPDVLERLLASMKEGVGAVAPAVLLPNPTPLPTGMKNTMSMLHSNVQWFKHTGIEEQEHLYSCFLYRKNIAHYELTLSPKAHREETIFSHRIKRAGYKLLVDFDAKVWHHRQHGGGIRSDNREQDYHHDEDIFQNHLRQWGIDKGESLKHIVLEGGLGDHYALKSILPEIREKYKHICVFSSFPDVFHDEKDLIIKSIAEAKLLFGDIGKFNIYRHMDLQRQKTTLIDAYRELYL